MCPLHCTHVLTGPTQVAVCYDKWGKPGEDVGSFTCLVVRVLDDDLLLHERVVAFRRCTDGAVTAGLEAAVAVAHFRGGQGQHAPVVAADDASLASDADVSGESAKSDTDSE